MKLSDEIRGLFALMDVRLTEYQKSRALDALIGYLATECDEGGGEVSARALYRSVANALSWAESNVSRFP